MQVSRRNAFLVLLLRQSRWTDWHRELLQDARFDWHRFYEFLRKHRLREYVYSTIVNTALYHQLPDDFATKLHHYMKYSRRRRARLLKMLTSACEILQIEGIPHLVLKGPALTHRVYPSADYRHQGDADLLVREADSQSAYHALITNGFQPKRGRTRLNRSRIRTQHAIEVRQDGLPLDLHWAIRRGPDYRLSEQAIWRDRMSCELDATCRQVLSDEHLLVMILLSLLHDLGRGGLRLKSLLDLSLFVEQQSEMVNSLEFWERRNEEAIAQHCRHILTICDAVLPGCGTELNWREHLGAGDVSELERTRQLAWQLITEERGSIENALWFARVHQLWRPKNAVWCFKQHLPSFRRAPLFSLRVINFCQRLLLRTLKKSFFPASDITDGMIQRPYDERQRNSAA